MKTITRFRIFLKFVGLCVLIQICLFFFRGSFHDGFEKISIVDLELCTNNPYETSSSNEQFCGKSFPAAQGRIEICGKIKTSDKFANPTIYVYKEGIYYPVFSGSIDKINSNNYFCKTIPLPDKDRNGFYRIKIYYARSLLVSSEFQIK